MSNVGFLIDESGATTVEWVVLTAAVLVVFGGVITVISTGVFSSSDELAEDVEAQAFAAEQTNVEAIALDAITAADLQDAPVEPDEFFNWAGANMWIDACIKTGGVPEVSVDSKPNADGSPSKITCM